MDQRKETDKYDNDDLRFFDKEPPFWPRVIGIGIMLVIAVLIVTYSTYQLLSITPAFIGEQTPSPHVLMVIVLVAIAFLLQLA